MRNRLKKIHAWGLKWADTPYSSLAMFLSAFAESSCFPVPTPMFFIAVSLIKPDKAYKFALSGTLGALFGSFLGYAIGHFAWLNADGSFTGFANFFFHHIPGFSEDLYNTIRELFRKWDFWVLFTASYTPIPYKVFSISAGVFGINLLMLFIGTLFGQGIRFFLIAYLVRKLGPAIRTFLARSLRPIAYIATTCLLAGLALLILLRHAG